MTIERLKLEMEHPDRVGRNRPRNLSALCQRCHILHDKAEHRGAGG